MNQHEKFELLCTLAAIGQIRDADLWELKRHIDECIDCQRRIYDFAQISAQALPLLGDEYGKPRSPHAMTTRFVERAQAEGIPLQRFGQVFPSRLSFGRRGWNEVLAAALLLVVIITASISHSFHLRARSVARGTTAEFRLPDEQVIQTRAVEHRPESHSARSLHVPARMQLSSQRSSSARTQRRFKSGRRDRSEDLRPTPSGAQCSDNGSNPRMLFNGEIFSSDVQMRPPELFQAYGNSARRSLAAELRIPLTQHNPFVDKAQYTRTDSRDHLITGSILSPDTTLPVVHFEAERVLRTGFDRSSSDLKFDIDWCEVWLCLRSKPPRDSDGFSPCAPRTWFRGGPFLTTARWSNNDSYESAP
jgi:hypothetical protein